MLLFGRASKASWSRLVSFGSARRQAAQIVQASEQTTRGYADKRGSKDSSGDDETTKNLSVISLIRDHSMRIDPFNDDLKEISKKPGMTLMPPPHINEETDYEYSMEPESTDSKTPNAMDVVSWNKSKRLIFATLPETLQEKLNKMAIVSMNLDFEIDMTNIKDALQTPNATNNLELYNPPTRKSLKNPSIALSAVWSDAEFDEQTIPLTFNALIQGTIEVDSSKLNFEQLKNTDVPEYNEFVTAIAANLCSKALKKGFPAEPSQLAFAKSNVAPFSNFASNNINKPNILGTNETHQENSLRTLMGCKAYARVIAEAISRQGTQTQKQQKREKGCQSEGSDFQEASPYAESNFDHTGFPFPKSNDFATEIMFAKSPPQPPSSKGSNPHIVCEREGTKGCISPGNAGLPFYEPGKSGAVGDPKSKDELKCKKKGPKSPCKSTKKPKKEDPCKKKDPCKGKKEDPCKKKKDPCKKKEDPCKKKKDPCKKKSESKKLDPCKGKKPKPCGQSKNDPCKKVTKKKDKKKDKKKEQKGVCDKPKKKKSTSCPTKKSDEDPCKKKDKKKSPCKKVKTPCAKPKKPKKKEKKEKKNPDCKPKKKEKKCNIEDPCKKKDKKKKKKSKKPEKKCDSESSEKLNMMDPCKRSKKCNAEDAAAKTRDACKKRKQKKICGTEKKEKKTKCPGLGKQKPKETKPKCKKNGDGKKSDSKCAPKKDDSKCAPKKNDSKCGSKGDKKKFSTLARILLNKNWTRQHCTVSFPIMRHFSSISPWFTLRSYSGKKGGGNCAGSQPSKPRKRKDIKSRKCLKKDCYMDAKSDDCVGSKLCKDPEETACCQYAKKSKSKSKSKKEKAENKKFSIPTDFKPALETTPKQFLLWCNHNKNYLKTRNFHTTAAWLEKWINSKDSCTYIDDDFTNHTDIKRAPIYTPQVVKPLQDPQDQDQEVAEVVNEIVQIADDCEVRTEYDALPTFGSYDVILRVMSVALSGSDIHLYETGGKNCPGVSLGHDAAGIVEAVGRNIYCFKPGDRVTIEPGLACGVCRLCKTGHYNMCPDLVYNGFLRKFQTHPADLCHKIPDSMSLDEAALVQPLAIACQACYRARITPQSNVLVMGNCAVAISVALCARAVGANRVCLASPMHNTLESIRDAFGLDYALYNDCSFGYQEALASIKAKLTEWPDIVINCSVSEVTMNIAIMALRPCGICVLTECEAECASFNAIDVLMKNITMIPSFRSANMYPTALRLIQNGCAPIYKLITNVYGWSQVEAAFRKAQNEANLGNGKVIVRCAEDEIFQGGTF